MRSHWLEYRRLGDEGGGWPGSLDDILQALELLTNTQDTGFQPRNITLVGHSAGGHLALLASQPQQRLRIRGVIGLAAITDIEAYAAGASGCQQAGANFLATAPESGASHESGQTVTAFISLFIATVIKIRLLH